MMEQKSFIWPSRVRFSDTDASGRIHYIAILYHFDAAEGEFMRGLGIGYRQIQTGQVEFPRVRVECDYLGAVRYDDVMEIAVSVDRVGRSSFTLAFGVNVDGREAARGKTTIVCMDSKTQKATPLPESLAAALKGGGS
jgi:YbgC/YbaW family acyl-CoA thioester hydrolase